MPEKRGGYEVAGVSIERGEQSVDLMRPAVEKTHGPEVLRAPDGFAGLYALTGYRDPVLASTIDGVGTKVLVAREVGRYGSLGADIVNHCANDVLATGADGVFFSNGPGDPATADQQVELLRQVLQRRVPFFGICFGNQLLGRALGLSTYKLRYGHRGINQPVLDRSTGRVEVTAHNHGFAVEAGSLPAEVEITHVNLNDNTIAGLRHKTLPIFSVQYHPESAPGPHDSEYLFERFVKLMSER